MRWSEVFQESCLTPGTQGTRGTATELELRARVPWSEVFQGSCLTRGTRRTQRNRGALRWRAVPSQSNRRCPPRPLRPLRETMSLSRSRRQESHTQYAKPPGVRSPFEVSQRPAYDRSRPCLMERCYGTRTTSVTAPGCTTRAPVDLPDASSLNSTVMLRSAVSANRAPLSGTSAVSAPPPCDQ
jgi:hypothetical protein